MTSNQKLLLAILAAPFVGALLFLLTDDRAQETGELVPQIAPEDEPAPLADVTVPDLVEEPDSKALAFMEARWGHMQDTGLASPKMDSNGEMAFVVPTIFRGRDGQGRPIYMRAMAKPQRLGPTVRASQAASVPSQRPTVEFDPARTLSVLSTLGPVDDPNDLPDELQKEHPLHPDYDGPGGK
jgi:hypothetical protein